MLNSIRSLTYSSFLKRYKYKLPVSPYQWRYTADWPKRDEHLLTTMCVVRQHTLVVRGECWSNGVENEKTENPPFPQNTIPSSVSTIGQSETLVGTSIVRPRVGNAHDIPSYECNARWWNKHGGCVIAMDDDDGGDWRRGGLARLRGLSCTRISFRRR